MELDSGCWRKGLGKSVPVYGRTLEAALQIGWGRTPGPTLDQTAVIEGF